MDAAQEALKLQREDLALMDGARQPEACDGLELELETKDGRIDPILKMNQSLKCHRALMFDAQLRLMP